MHRIEPGPKCSLVSRDRSSSPDRGHRLWTSGSARIFWFDSSGKALLERGFRRSFFLVLLLVVRPPVRSRLSSEFGLALRGELENVSSTSVMGVDAIDSTFAMGLTSCFELELQSHTGMLRFIYDASLPGTVEEKNLSTSSPPFDA